MQNFEGLGTFYLGAKYDLASRRRGDELVLYDAKDLVTHAVCVGMTGSGKTGLCTVLLEEAALDGIPALVIDPKGDLANLLLTFPNLSAADFAPWVDPGAARTKGQTPEQFAAAQSELWKRGLAEWGQDGARIARLREACELAVYTPGSNAGTPVSILASFAAPDSATLDDAEACRERVQTTVSSLLALAGIDADPVQSREHILLSTLVQRAWSERRDLDLGALIGEVQKPGIAKLGVLDLESFFPAKERVRLALALNNLLASPGFGAWLEGEPLDIDRLLYTPAAKPRIAIFSIAHLADAQRMFFVSLLLNETLAWTRRQRGTSSLRALVYMDEISGYFPPVANPPSKAPLLTLMKQARAFGVGVVVATQNPVDLDYKGLANAGTWFVGRLQTERDKARLLDGLEGALSASGAGFDRAEVERTLSALSARVFLMHNVHDDGPTLLETRWAMSYLRGPMTRAELKLLTEARRSSSATASPPPAPRASVASSPTVAPAASAAPLTPPDVPAYFLPSRAAGAIEYRPALFASARVRFVDAKTKLALEIAVNQLAECACGPVPIDWQTSSAIELDEGALEREPVAGATFAELPPECARAKSYDAWRKAFVDHLLHTAQLELFESPRFKLVSTPGESERDFRLRVEQSAREARDRELGALREKFAGKLATLEERRRKREQALAVQRQQATDAKASTAISFGSALLSAFLGKKTLSAGSLGRAGSAARGVSRSRREAGDVGRAEADVAAAAQAIAELERSLESELGALTSAYAVRDEPLTRCVLRPKRNAIAVRAVVLAWAPYRCDAGGSTPAWL